TSEALGSEQRSELLMTRTSVAILAMALTAGSLAGSAAVHAADSVRIAQAGPAAPPRAAAPKTAPAAQAGSESSLRQRVDQLEEQLVDMQVTVGTIETMARSGGGGSAPRMAGAGGASDAARLD